MIKNVIFDLGNVLVKADFYKVREKLLQNGISEEEFMDVFARSNKIQMEFESGIINIEQFLDTCIELLNGAVSKEIFIECFNGMFDEITEMKEFLANLAGSRKYKIYLLSNTNPLHFEYILEKYNYVNLIENFLLSYKLGCLKPESYIYEKVIRENNLIPEETVFIDDLEENCQSAGKLGIKTIQYKNYEDFIKDFNKLTL